MFEFINIAGNIVLGIIVIVIIIGMILNSIDKHSPKQQKLKKEHKDAFSNQLHAYEIEKSILVEENFSNTYNIGISTITKTIVIYKESTEIYIPHKIQAIPFDKIVGSELVENNEVIKKGWVGRSIIGGSIAGGAGAIIGAMTRGENNIVKSLKIKIILNDELDPLCELPIITFQTNRDSSKYTKLYKTAEELYATIVSIEKRNNSYENEQDSITDLKRYKELLDEGIITQEEFNAKKKQLLNL